LGLLERNIALSQSEAIIFIIILVSLVFLSAFFSAAETGLMAINRYRLKHKARKKKSAAALILQLLKRPDRLLGAILIGNNCANIFASALATLLAMHFFGEKAVIITTVLLTLIILVFSEIAPKTLAALYPERISQWVAYPINFLLKLFYPLVWILNSFSNGLLRLFGVDLSGQEFEPLSREELRTVVYETTGRISKQYQNMLLGILDLNQETVEDVMVPSHQITGINLESDWEEIKIQLGQSKYDWLPVYREHINQVEGILHLRDIVHELFNGILLSKEALIAKLRDPYFIPEGTPLNIQLLNFQREKKHLALVVDEYGEVLGLVTLVDILEEIVGEFATTVSPGKLIEKEGDNSYLADGSITLRELNRIMKAKFSLKGPRTLNGIITEQLETMPKVGVCLLISNYPLEIIEVEDNRVKKARVFPRLSMK
jgi:Mg2+/Co2+ transporter CorB